MIFLTVGTTKFSFLRILKSVDKALIFSRAKEKLIAQVGPNDYQFTYQNTQTFSEIPFTKMVYYLSHARLVITHGGLGTIFLGLKHAKNKLLVVPRIKQFNEHVDDHQLFFAKFLKKKGLIEAVFPKEDLKKKVVEYITFPEKSLPRKRTLASKELVKKLTEYTENFREKSEFLIKN